jgi:hypothetical protein
MKAHKVSTLERKRAEKAYIMSRNPATGVISWSKLRPGREAEPIPDPGGLPDVRDLSALFARPALPSPGLGLGHPTLPMHLENGPRVVDDFPRFMPEGPSLEEFEPQWTWDLEEPFTIDGFADG